MDRSECASILHGAMAIPSVLSDRLSTFRHTERNLVDPIALRRVELVVVEVLGIPDEQHEFGLR
jgi:hypothetical protein